LEKQLELQLIEDRELALAQKVIDRIPEKRRPYVLRLLSLAYATKSGGETKG
jgi:hypothetical protein